MSDINNSAKPLTRNLYFCSQVDQASIKDLIKEIIKISEHDQRLKKLYAIDNLKYEPEPIKIYIDSYGGHVYQCFGLLNIMNKCKTPIHTIVTGCAMSCGFMILICGHKRFGYDLSSVLYHQVTSGGRATVKELSDELKQSKKLQKKIEKIVINKTKISKEKLKKIYKTKKDWYIDSSEALKLKIIDKII